MKLKLNNKKLVFLDGAMGTGLLARGVAPTPIANIKTPGLVREILRNYVKAGSDIIETNTF